MKKLLIILTSLLLVSTVFAASFVADITLSWQPNPPEQFITKYLVYQAKLPSTNFVAVVTAAGTTNSCRVRVTSAGTYQFKITAVNGAGESGFSALAQYPTVAPTVPTNVIVTSIVVK